VPDLIQNWDIIILNCLRSNDSQVCIWLAWLLASMAWKGVTFWILAAVFWLAGKRTQAVQIALALLIAVVEIGALKGIVARPRPDLYVSQHLHIPMPELLSTAHSFPSGHVTLVAAGVYILATIYGGWIALVGWLFVVLVGVARVYQGLHWPSDIVGSILLGIVAGVLAQSVLRIPSIKKLLRVD
jgi:membrane-associated phospholipid phosphatase